MATATATSQTLASKKAKGERLGAPGDQRRNTQRASITRIVQADVRSEEIMRLLLEDPVRQSLSHKGLAMLLNAKGLKTGRRKPFTKDNIRKPKQRALESIRARQGSDAEVDVGPFADAMISTDVFGSGLPKGIRIPSSKSPEPIEPSSLVAAPEAQDEKDDYKNVPLYGTF